MSEEGPAADAKPVTPASVQENEGSDGASEVHPGFTVGGAAIWSPGRLSLPFRLLFHHVSRLVSTGYLRRLEPEDLYGAPELDMATVRWGGTRAQGKASLVARRPLTPSLPSRPAHGRV